MALRTVPWLTRKRAAKSISLGMASPGFHSPDCRLCKISPLICWYSGLNAGAGRPAAPVGEAGVSAAKEGVEGIGVQRNASVCLVCANGIVNR